MRYLVNREDFIRKAKVTETKSDFLMEKEESKIYEAGGPFTNNVKWNDSLLGRLVNHIVRETLLLADMVRIKPLTRRLRMQFDRLAAEGMIAKIATENQSDPYKVMLSSIYEELVLLVDRQGNVGEIKRMAKLSLDKTIEYLPSFKDEDKKELEMCKKELEAFIKAIEPLNDSDGGKPSVVEEDGEEDGEVDETAQRIKNFGHLFRALLVYQGIKREIAIVRKQQQLQPQQSGTQSVSAPATGVNVGQTTTTNVNAGRLYNYQSFMSINEEEGVAKVAGKVVGTILKFFRGGKDERQVAPETKKLMDALDKLWQLFNTDKGVLEKNSDLDKFLSRYGTLGGFAKGSKEEKEAGNTYNKFKGNIDRIYGKVKATGIVKEGVHELLGKTDQIGSYIAAIYNVTKTKPNGNFPEYPGVVGEAWDELCDEIAGFNLTLPGTLSGLSGSSKVDYKQGQKVSWTSKETGSERTAEIVRVEGNTLIFKDKKGQEFKKSSAEVKLIESIASIFEADTPENPQTTPENPQATPDKTDASTDLKLIETGSTSERIKDFFDRNCKTVRNYVLDKAEVDKITANLEKLKDDKDFVIDGMDPVIQIVRLFNRAYKIYTVETITKQSDGKVSPVVYKQYTALGGRSSSGDLNGWAGPFRAKKVFNIWEDAVLKIMGDKRYEFIFSSATKLRLPKVSDPKGPEDYEYRTGAGAKLRDFMNDMLDGEDLYKAGGTDSGAQKKFIEKYFGKLDPSSEGKSTTLEQGEGKEIGELAQKIDESRPVLTFQELDQPDFKPNSFFALKISFTDKEGNKTTKWRYFKIEDDNTVSFTKTFYYFDKMLTYNSPEDPLDGRKFTSQGGKIDKMEKRQKPDKGEYYQMCYARTRMEMAKLFRRGNKLKLSYIEGGQYEDLKEESYTIENVYWLCEKDDKDKPLQFTINIKPEDIKKYFTMYSTSHCKLQSDVNGWIRRSNKTNISLA